MPGSLHYRITLRSSRVLRLPLLAFVLLPLAGCGLWKKDAGPLPPVAELYQQGEDYLRRERYEDARKNFKRLAESYADTEFAPRARFLIGEAFYREENYDEAVKARSEERRVGKECRL